MNYYFDTSALVKIYHREDGTDRVLVIYKGDEPIAISELSRIEFIATVMRKYREQAITLDTLQSLLTKFQEDLEQRYDVLKFSSLVIEEADNLLCRFGEQHGLKTLDSLQFAFLTTYCEQDTRFVCSDTMASQLVKDEGFNVIVPEQPDVQNKDKCEKTG
ncbi:MAG: type II toxin-antitoxin system VapC family toxin [bacterium]